MAVSRVVIPIRRYATWVSSCLRDHRSGSRSTRHDIVRCGSSDGSSHKRPRFASSTIKTITLRRFGVRRFVRQPLPPRDAKGYLWRQGSLSMDRSDEKGRLVRAVKTSARLVARMRYNPT